MEEFQFSSHALSQMEYKGISSEIVMDTLNDPLTGVENEGQKIYQKLFKLEKIYLIRVFVNNFKSPMLIKTVYKTSKIKKYYEGKI